MAPCEENETSPLCPCTTGSAICSPPLLSRMALPGTTLTLPFLSSSQIAILQLIEAGKLTLDSPVHTWLPELTPPLQVLDSISADGTPVFHTTDTPILIKQMLNQTSGFGQEFGPEVSGWKKWT